MRPLPTAYKESIYADFNVAMYLTCTLIEGKTSCLKREPEAAGASLAREDAGVSPEESSAEHFAAAKLLYRNLMFQPQHANCYMHGHGHESPLPVE